MRSFILRTCLLLAGTLLCAYSSGQQASGWYVAPDGNDINKGERNTPLKTVAKALEYAKPGDTVFLREGAYSEFVVPTRSGEPGKLITIKSYPGETARIDGTHLYIKGWGNALVQVSNVSYIQFEDLHICHAHDSENNTDPEGIYISGTSSDITFRNCKIYDIKNDCPVVDAKGDWRSAHAILVLGNNDKTPVRNLLIEKCEIFEIHSGTSEAFTLAGNVVDFTIQDNEVHDVENIGIIIAGGDNLNPQGDISVNYARDGVVRRNRVYRCTHEKSQDYWGQSVSNGGAIGIYLCGNGNTIVEQNEVFECDRGIGLCSESYKLQTKDCIVRNNFVYNNYRTGIYMGAYLGFDGLSTRNCYVVNNTLFNNNLKGGQLNGTNNYLKVNDRDNSSEGEIRLSELCEDNVITNNVIYAISDRDIFVRKYTTSGKNNFIGGNLYFSPTKKNHKWMWDGVEYTDFASWQAASGDMTSVFDENLIAGKGYADTFEGVRGLVGRRAPWLAGQVRFNKIPSSNESSFTLQTVGKNLVIGATDVNAAAVGVNWYLKYYCHRSMSHLGDQLTPVTELPVIEKTVTVKTSSIYRYALNYCTYNYTMSFYTWDDWQREIDWMALNGVNLMLVANGSEAVWQNTLRRMNYQEKEIADFITGPAYNAWWLMGNIEGWGGPMPQSQIDSRKELVQQMLSRMKSLGIEPLMPGFYGMVPSNLKKKSKAHIITQGNWGAFTRPDILDPTDPEFERIAAIFYDETRRLYGSDIRFFSGDPFHEGGATEGVSLGDAGRAIQKVMQKYFPGSIWVLQGWQDNPKPGLLEKLDKRYVLVQELFGENTNNWETRKGYEGTPFIWATVTNFGERPGINGKLQRFADEVYRASHGEYAQYMKGVGVIPEGINNNPVTYELLFELVWHKDHVDVNQWIDTYITARYGKITNEVRTAWQMMLKSIYSSEIGYQEGPPENILCARPSLELKSVSSWGRLAKKYDLDLFKEAALLFAKALPEFRNVRTYRIDLIHFLRQMIANDADRAFADMVAAYQEKNAGKFETEVAVFLEMIDTENELLSQDPFFRLSTWQQQAQNAGNTSAEKKNNLHNLMMLITYWGEHVTMEDNLHDYAYKEWAGMMITYYKGRWMVYFDYLRALLRGEQAKAPDYFHWEREWVEKNLRMADDAPRMSLEEIVNKVRKTVNGI